MNHSGSPNKHMGASKSQKRHNESLNVSISSSKKMKVEQKSPKKSSKGTNVAWNFDDVKNMLEKIECPTKLESWTSSMKKIDFDKIKFGSYTAENCKKLFDDLVHSTRRYRTMSEILNEIKENLSKKTYTRVICKSAIIGELPKRPPSAYILFHAEKMLKKRAKDPNLKIKDGSAEISQQWKELPEKEKDNYRQRERSLKEKYDQDLKRLGLIDALPPKRPPSARLLYIESKLENKDLTEDELAKLKAKYGQKFDEMSAEEKEKYTKRHNALVEEYKKKMEQYIKSTPHLQHNKPVVERKNKTIKQPEAPKSALKFFLDKKLNNLESEELESAKAKYTTKFKNLSDNKLIKYVKKAINDKQRYEQEVKEFKEAHPEIELKPKKPNLNEKQRDLYEKLVLKRPQPPAGSAYIEFCGKKLSQIGKDNEDFHPTAQMRTVSAEWKEFSGSDLLMAQESVIKSIEAYIPAMEAWLAEQPIETQLRIQKEEARAMPDFWRKVLQRRKKALNKMEQEFK